MVGREPESPSVQPRHDLTLELSSPAGAVAVVILAVLACTTGAVALKS